MRYIILLFALLFSVASFAATADDGTGFIIGFNLGSAKIDYEPDSYSSYITSYTVPAYDINHRRGFAWNTYIGYKLYKQLAWQIGYTKYQDADFHYNAAPTSMKLKRYDYDFLMRGEYQISKNFAGLLRFGVARVEARMEAADGSTTNLIAWTPAYGMGVAYYLNNNINISGQWLRTQKVKSVARTSGVATPDIPNTDFYSVGLMYRF